MDTSMDLCYQLRSHTEASSSLILTTGNSSGKEYNVTWSKGLSTRRSKRARAAHGSGLPTAKKKVSWGDFNIPQLRPSQSNLVRTGTVWAALRPPEPWLGYSTAQAVWTCPSSLSQRSTMAIPPAGKCAFTVLEWNRVTQLGFQTRPGVTDRARGHTFPRCSGIARSSVVHHPPQLTKPDPPGLSAEAVGSKLWVPSPNPEKKSGQFAIPTAKLWPHFRLLSGTKQAFYLADEDNYFMYCGYA